MLTTLPIGESIYDFDGKRLGGYTLDSNLISLYLLDYGIGHRGRLITMSAGGDLSGEMITDREILSISSGKDHLGILYIDGPVILNKSLEEINKDREQMTASGASCILVFGNDAVLIAGDHISTVIKIEKES